MEMILTIIPTNLDTNSLLSIFCPFIDTKNKNQISSKLMLWLQEIVLVFVYSKSCSTPKVCQIQQTFIKGFSYVLFLLVLQFHGLSICFSSKLNIASNDSIVNKQTLISTLIDSLVLDDKACESSTTSNRLILLNSLNNIACIVFL